MPLLFGFLQNFISPAPPLPPHPAPAHTLEKNSYFDHALQLIDVGATLPLDILGDSRQDSLRCSLGVVTPGMLGLRMLGKTLRASAGLSGDIPLDSAGFFWRVGTPGRESATRTGDLT